MIIALNEKSERIKATPGVRAYCPNCNELLIPKCGEIKVHHFSHKGENDCDIWGEESEWHRNWKNLFPIDYQEKWMDSHRADVKLPNGRIIEFQSSAIKPSVIREREQFYKDMIWVLKGEDFDSNFDLRNKGNYFTFRWKYPRSSWWSAQKPIFIDFSDSMVPPRNHETMEDYRGIFHVKKIYNSKYCGGWGVMIDKNDFLRINGINNKNEL